MNQTNTVIVVSRFQEDTAWTRKLTDKGFRVLIYDHGTNPNNPYNLPGNIGHEAGAYIKYMMDYYDHLTPYTVFVHADERAWHHDGSLVDHIVSLVDSKKALKYESFNNLCMASVKNSLYKETCQFFDKYLARYIGSREQYGDWTMNHFCCAQFVVHKSMIQKHPQKMYEDIYKYIKNKSTRDGDGGKKAGHMLEWTWHLILGNPKLKGNASLCKRIL